MKKIFLALICVGLLGGCVRKSLPEAVAEGMALGIRKELENSKPCETCEGTGLTKEGREARKKMDSVGRLLMETMKPSKEERCLNCKGKGYVPKKKGETE